MQISPNLPKQFLFQIFLGGFLLLIAVSAIFYFIPKTRFWIQNANPTELQNEDQIKLLETGPAALKERDSAGAAAPCQPESFDPAINKFYRIKQNGTPAELYKIEGFNNGFEVGSMMIDGWYKEGENKISLPHPFDVTVYNFGCASSFSFVLDLKKNGVRQALYNHVLHYNFSKDGKYLYLVDNVNDLGNWLIRKRIINIEVKTESKISNFSCASDLDGFWQEDRLLTYSETNDVDKLSKRVDYTTDICVWSEKGVLLSRIGANMAWAAASRDILGEKMGLLPNEKNVFFAYTSKDDNTCSLFLLDIREKNQLKIIDILNKNNYPQDQIYYCMAPEVDFDFNKTYFKRGVLRYRIEQYQQYGAEKEWSDWEDKSF